MDDLTESLKISLTGKDRFLTALANLVYVVVVGVVLCLPAIVRAVWGWLW